MLRSPSRIRPYQVAFSPEAWSLVGAMGAETFKHLQAELHRLAEAAEEASEAEAPSVRSTTVEDWVVLYERHPATRTLTVRTLTRRRTEPAGK